MNRILQCIVVIVVFIMAILFFHTLRLSEPSNNNAPAITQKPIVSSTPDGDEPASLHAPFKSKLPIIHINTEGRTITKEEITWGGLSVIDTGMQNDSTQNPTFASLISVKYRGNSSYYIFDKRQFRIKLYRTEKKEISYGMLGMGTHSEWVLYGPFLDRSLVRNRLMFELSRELLPWAPDTRYVEVIVNNVYQGVYLAVEPVTNGENRLDLVDFGLASGESAYIARRDREGTQDNAIITYGQSAGKTKNEVSISYPATHKLTSKQKQWITDDISQFEKVLYASWFSDPKIGYAAYIDVNTFVDYFLLNELAMIPDASELSTYFYKNIGGKLKLTVWDFNNGFDNYPWRQYSTKQWYLADSNWFDRLLEDRVFVDAVIARYRALRADLWSDERLLSLIDKAVADIGKESIARNFDVWGYTFDDRLLSKDADGNSRDPRNFQEAVQMLHSTLDARVDYMDTHIEELYAFCIE